MKTGLWILILALASWTIDSDHWMSSAWAGVSLSATSTSTTTQIFANGSIATITDVHYATVTTTDTSTTGTNSSCANGGQWSWCSSNDPAQQKNSQNNTNDLNNQGANQSTMLGMAAIAAGMAMVAAGMAMLSSPPTAAAGAALIAAGMALIASGMAALAAAAQMNNNANKAAGYAGNLDNLAPYQSSISSTPGTSADTTTTGGSIDSGQANVANGSTSGIKIDPALTRTGKLDSIFSNMENATGLNRDAMLSAVGSGTNPLDLLANSPALAGKPSASSENLQKMMDDTMAKGNLPSGQDVMDKLGLNASDLGASGDTGASGANPNRSLASTNANPNLDALFPGAGANGSGADGKNTGSAMKVSSEVQAALDRNGITSRSIFDMVHSQYTKKTPLLFGVPQKKDSTSPNPYMNLGSEKIEI